MKKFLPVFSICLGLLIPGVANATANREDLQARLDSAKVVLDEVLNTPDRTVPLNILQQATCVGVIPGMIKGAFVFGAEYGQGVVTCRTGHGWSAPVFIRLAGGSFGFQIGGQATDLILVAVNDKGFQDLLKNKFKIGGDVAASAGPVGRNSQAATDWKMGAELLTYSRSKGLFAGVDLNGETVSQNSDDTASYYGQAHSFQSVLKGDVDVPEGAVRTVAHAFIQSKNQ
jgi:SH3 domain-containing YSC84-like protein 1